MVNINNKFPLGSFVFVVHDEEFKRMVTGLEIYIDGSYQYKFRVISVDDNQTTKIFEGDYYITLFKVVYLNQDNLI